MTDSTRFSGVLDEMKRQVAAGLRPSLQVAVDWHGERVFDQACGDGAAKESTYLLWSSTKPFIAILLLQLIEEGRAELDDRVGKYIPEFAILGKERATLAHVLTHRGGFPDTLPDAHRGLRHVLHDFSAALRYVCEMRALWEPGHDRGYHPASGWIVLGELVQRIAERPLAEALRTRVLEPLAIPGDAFSLGEPQLLRCPAMPISSTGERGAPPESEVSFWNDPATHAALIPGAGGISSAAEVVKLYRALLDGGMGPEGRILSREMIQRATFPHAVGNVDRTFQRDIPWGLGFHLKHVRPSLDDCGTTATPGTFGHGGHFLVNTAWADPGKDLAACILSNGLTDSRSGIRAVSALSQAIHDVVDGSDG